MGHCAGEWVGLVCGEMWGLRALMGQEHGVGWGQRGGNGVGSGEMQGLEGRVRQKGFVGWGPRGVVE